MPPNIPTFTPSQTSHLATDRHSFELHLEGTDPPNRATLFPGTHSFRHTADQIDVIPAITISGNPCSNVNQALLALAAAINPSAPQKATTSIFGVIQLSGDLGENAPGVATVVGIQGKPVLNTPPTTNQVLTFNGSQWAPATSGAFTAASDLTGNNTYQNVIGLTGDTTTNPGYHTVRSSADYIQFVPSAVPNITQTQSSGSVGTNMTISAQSVVSGTGGQLVLGGGQAGSGLSGGVSLDVGSNNVVFEVAQVNSSAQTVAAFFPPPTGLTSAQMPVNTGNNVIYVGSTSTPPTIASPSGAILWADNLGNLNVMQGNGNSFVVGSIPNPSVWGTLTPRSGQSLTYRSSAITTNYQGVNVFPYPSTAQTFAMPPNTCVRVDCIFVAKRVGSTDCAQYNLSLGFVVDGLGSVMQLGTTTSTDSRFIGTWVSPTISNSGNYLVVNTGYTTAGSSNWEVITQIILSPQG